MSDITDDFFQDDISPCAICGQTVRGEMYREQAENGAAVWYCIDCLPDELLMEWLDIDQAEGVSS